ncbi:MAG TPA: hypothetical protein VLS86_08855, partial [Acidimicrobiia bacterium]|nr:hypothetical protein [Acidimicrobiia bacterium]
MTRKQSTPDELLDAPEGAPVLYLLDAGTDHEAGMMQRWLSDQLGSDADTLRISSSRRGRGGDTEELARV